MLLFGIILLNLPLTKMELEFKQPKTSNMSTQENTCLHKETLQNLAFQWITEHRLDCKTSDAIQQL